MIKFEVIGSEDVMARFVAVPGKARDAAVSYLNNWAARLAAYIVSEKLSGSPLHRRSGRLSSSVHPYTDVSDDAVTGGAGAGRDVPYAFIHEYGGTIHHPGGTAYFVSALLGKTIFVSNDSPSAAWLPRTKPHDIVMPERSYMRSSLKEMAQEGIAGLRLSVAEAILQ